MGAGRGRSMAGATLLDGLFEFNQFMGASHRRGLTGSARPSTYRRFRLWPANRAGAGWLCLGGRELAWLENFDFREATGENRLLTKRGV